MSNQRVSWYLQSPPSTLFFSSLFSSVCAHTLFTTYQIHQNKKLPPEEEDFTSASQQELQVE